MIISLNNVGGAAPSNELQIIEGGKINSKYTYSGYIYQESDRVRIYRNGSSPYTPNGGQLGLIDFTDYNTMIIYCSVQTTNGPLDIEIPGISYVLTTGPTCTIDVSSVTGLKNINLLIYSAVGVNAYITKMSLVK